MGVMGGGGGGGDGFPYVQTLIAGLAEANGHIYIYTYIYIVEEGLDGHGLLLLSFTRYAIVRRLKLL